MTEQFKNNDKTYYFGPDEVNRILNDQVYNYQISNVKPTVLEKNIWYVNSGHEVAFHF